MKKFKLDPNANSFASCPDEFYCEYYFTGGDWYLIGANTQSGYYCPVQPPIPPSAEGDVVCAPQYRGGSHQVADFSEGEHYVEYEYRDGQFHLKQANCPVGFHAPADPLEFAKEHGTLRIYPARIKKTGGSETA